MHLAIGKFNQFVVVVQRILKILCFLRNEG